MYNISEYNANRNLSKDNNLEVFIKLLYKVNYLSVNMIKPYMTLLNGFLNIKENKNENK